MTDQRSRLVRRGLWLNYATLAYNSVEAVVALIAGHSAGSVALFGFGIDSVIEVSASLAAQWRLRSDDPHRRERVERHTSRIIGISFLALAAYIAVDSVKTLLDRTRPSQTIVGMVLLVASVIVMPLLAHAKGKVARSMQSRALSAESRQTNLCAYLSAIALAGVALNTFAGWWWADPLAALAMVPIISREGFEGIRAEKAHDDCC